MTSILSAISGQFTKSLILGTFFPVAVFVTLALIFVVPLFPADSSLLKPLETLDTQWKLITVSFIMVVLTGVLYNLNIPIIRFYEGYPWEDSWIGQWCINRYKARFYAADARWKGVRTLLRTPEISDQHYETILDKWAEIGQRVNSEFPGEASSILPTHLGNVIRSFEYYPDHQYGIEAITLWTRLIAKIDKDYAAVIDDTKTSFGFMLNGSVLSAILGLVILIVGLFSPTPLASPRLWVPWLLEISVFVALSYLLYLGSIDAASAWGDMVKGAFDLYRWDLLKQLGYTQMPTTNDEERALWDDISRRMLYGPSPTSPEPDYVVVPSPRLLTFAHGESDMGEPDALNLEITRGVKPPSDDEVITIVLYVKNNDPQKRTANNTVVTDTLPDGYDYEWSSARSDNRSIHMVGANPYHFHIGDLEPDEEVLLTYRAIPRKK